jgi:hypothetical protein
MIYLYSISERQRVIADIVADRTRDELGSAPKRGSGAKRSGTDVARRKRKAS